MQAFQWLIYDSFKVYLGVSIPESGAPFRGHEADRVSTASHDRRALRLLRIGQLAADMPGTAGELEQDGIPAKDFARRAGM